MTRELRNVAASVRQRLSNLAKERERPFQELLQYFAIERFLYRPSKSSHRDRFLLKGALMLAAWRGPATRSTMDIDLLGSGEDPASGWIWKQQPKADPSSARKLTHRSRY